MTITTFFQCPECGKRIVLLVEETTDNVFTWVDMMQDIKKYRDDTLRGVTTDRYLWVLESRRWKQFFADNLFLTFDGLQQLVNSFIVWAGPQVAEMEQKITGLVSKQTFGEFFKKMEESEEEE